MSYIIVRTYGNGKHMNRVYPMFFEWLSQAERVCAELNALNKDDTKSDKWIVMPITQYMGNVW